MKKRIVVVDGMGGGIGAQIIERLKPSLGPGVEVLALGANSGATERMMKAGADRGASGENAVRVSVGSGMLIIGPIGILIPNGMLGEITPAMAEAVMAAPCERILVPVAQDHFALAGLEPRPLGYYIDTAVGIAKSRIDAIE